LKIRSCAISFNSLIFKKYDEVIKQVKNTRDGNSSSKIIVLKVELTLVSGIEINKTIQLKREDNKTFARKE
jgi:hypothetical protein